MHESLLVSSLNHRSLNLPGGAPEGTDARLQVAEKVMFLLKPLEIHTGHASS